MNIKLKLVSLLTSDDIVLHNCHYLYNEKKYQECEEIYSAYYNNYGNDPDILHNFACSMFMQQKYELALQYLKKSSHIAWSYHSSYHFISSALYYNKALETGNIKYFEKAEFLYHENDNAKRGINGDIINIKQSPAMFNATNTLGDSLIFEQNRYKFCTADDYLKDIENEHFKYHCMTARQFFNRAVCFSILEQNDIAKFDIIRAIEFDLKNPDNDFYKNFADKLHFC